MGSSTQILLLPTDSLGLSSVPIVLERANNYPTMITINAKPTLSIFKAAEAAFGNSKLFSESTHWQLGGVQMK